MRLFFNILLSIVALAGINSCGRLDPIVVDGLEAVEGEVRIVLPEQDTRATLAADGLNFVWQLGDRFKLAAIDSNGSHAFTPCNFNYWISTTTVGRGIFRGVPDSKMADGNYTYYAVYPHTATIGEKTISYTLPLVQDGNYASNDFMVAKSAATNSAAASGNALKACDNSPETPEPLNDINLIFKHQLHAMRITIPEGRNQMNVPIKKVYVNFPAGVNVVGDITIDMATMAATYTNTFNAVTVEFAQPKNVGEEFWIMTLPMNVGGGKVDLRFEDEQGNISSPISTTAFASCAANRITPMTVTVPQSAGKMTYFDFEIKDNYLGEPATHMHITPPSGCYYVHGSGGQMPDASGTFTFGVFPDQLSLFKGYSTSAIKYESVHAIVPEKASRSFSSSAAQGNRYSQKVDVPYLFEEDFSTIEDFDYYGGNVNTKDDKGQVLDHDFRTYGWSANQCAGEAGKAMSIRSRMETNWGRYFSRVDSAPMIGLKDGVSVTVIVSFDYSASANDADDDCMSMSYGYTTKQGTIQAYKLIRPIVTEIVSGNHAENAETIPITTGGSMDKIDKEITDFKIPSCTNSHRITWELLASGHYTGSKNHWLYIDNIKVSIVQ